jgi:hypothetical protein
MEDEDSGSERLVPKDAYWQVRYKLKAIEEWRRKFDEEKEEIEDRIRALEDWKLEQRTRLRDFIKWVSILAAAITATIGLLERMIFK